MTRFRKLFLDVSHYKTYSNSNILNFHRLCYTKVDGGCRKNVCVFKRIILQCTQVEERSFVYIAYIEPICI